MVGGAGVSVGQVEGGKEGQPSECRSVVGGAGVSVREEVVEGARVRVWGR